VRTRLTKEITPGKCVKQSPTKVQLLTSLEPKVFISNKKLDENEKKKNNPKIKVKKVHFRNQLEVTKDRNFLFFFNFLKL
jgi:hypothetical protein